MYREWIGTIAEVQPGDQVWGRTGSNGQPGWVTVKEVYPAHLPHACYYLKFSTGSAVCSRSHQWEVFMEEHDQNAQPTGHAHSLGEVDTAMMIQMNDSFGPLHVGLPDGPVLLSAEPAEPVECCCILVENDDHHFEILLQPLDGGDGYAQILS